MRNMNFALSVGNGAFYSHASCLALSRKRGRRARCASLSRAVTRGRCAATCWKVPASPESVIFLDPCDFSWPDLHDFLAPRSKIKWHSYFFVFPSPVHVAVRTFNVRNPLAVSRRRPSAQSCMQSCLHAARMHVPR